MTRALGRFAFLLLFHLTMVASGYACANPSMAMGHEEHGKHHQTPSMPERCLAPASCAPAMAVAGEVRIERAVAEAASAPAFRATPTIIDRAAPDTPPPRV